MPKRRQSVIASRRSSSAFSPRPSSSRRIRPLSHRSASPSMRNTPCSRPRLSTTARNSRARSSSPVQSTLRPGGGRPRKSPRPSGSSTPTAHSHPSLRIFRRNSAKCRVSSCASVKPQCSWISCQRFFQPLVQIMKVRRVLLSIFARV